jgi:hypothetical protein
LPDLCRCLIVQHVPLCFILDTNALKWAGRRSLFRARRSMPDKRYRMPDATTRPSLCAACKAKPDCRRAQHTRHAQIRHTVARTRDRKAAPPQRPPPSPSTLPAGRLCSAMPPPPTQSGRRRARHPSPLRSRGPVHDTPPSPARGSHATRPERRLPPAGGRKRGSRGWERGGRRKEIEAGRSG